MLCHQNLAPIAEEHDLIGQNDILGDLTRLCESDITVQLLLYCHDLNSFCLCHHSFNTLTYVILLLSTTVFTPELEKIRSQLSHYHLSYPPDIEFDDEGTFTHYFPSIRLPATDDKGNPGPRRPLRLDNLA